MANQYKDLLVNKLGVKSEDYFKIETKYKKKDQSFVGVVESFNVVPKETFLKEYAKLLNVPYLKSLKQKDVPGNIIALIPSDLAKELMVIPIDRAGNNMFIATSEPRNIKLLDKIRYKTGYTPKPVLASESEIREEVNRYYGKSIDMSSFKQTSEDEGSTNVNQGAAIRTEIGADGGDGPIIKLVNKTLVECLNRGASDIHYEPYEEFMRIRLRVDGVLQEVVRPPISMRDALISRIKIMSKLNIAEKRLPQDGAININIGGKPVDFRVNSLPTVYGEKIVMRILDKSNLQVDMTALGFEKEQLHIFQESIHKPFGIVLVTGPTGSGKTTTLYSGLAELNKESENIMTAEDPVEFNLPGINQVHTKPEIGLDFAAALKAFLRQDPDVIMVGEIRDLTTAEIAIKASLTGHLVLSTLHTNSATDTISRLLNMGVEPFNLVAALNCITAQRLLRKICTGCRVEDTETQVDSLIPLGMPKKWVGKIKLYKGAGCAKCGGTGMKGRVAVHEVLAVTDPIKESILRGDSSLTLKKVAIHHGMKTLRMSALTKMAQGLTTATEVAGRTGGDSEDEEKEKKGA